MTSRVPPPRWGSSDPLLDARIADTIDLHQLTRADAEARVRSYLATARKRYAGQVVHIITGKGRGSAGGAVLKPAIGRLLKSLGTLVSDFDQDVDGGGFLVKLKL